MPDPNAQPTPGAVPPSTPAGEPQPGAPAATEQDKQTSGWKAAEQFKAERDAIKAERDALKAERQKETDAKLAEQGKWQELAKSKESEAADARAERDAIKRSFSIFTAGIKAGANDPADLDPFLAKVDVGNPDALSAALTELKSSKPYLFGGKSGNPTPTPQANPGGNPAVAVPKVSAGEVANLTREQKQAVADSYFKGGTSGFFGRK